MLSQLICAEMVRRQWQTVVACLLASLLCNSSLNAQVPNSRQARDKARAFEKFQAAIQQSRFEFFGKLEEIAQECDAQELTLEAKEIRQLAKPIDPNIVQGKNLPREIQLPIPQDLPEAERKWRQELRTLQTEYAAALFTKAKKAKDNGRISLAFELIREVVRHDPDHRFARRLLGYVRYGDEWVTFHTKKMLEQKLVLTPEFGWLKADHVGPYQKGERYYNSSWISAAKEAELRRNFDKAWVVTTDHYEIRTNHSLEMGVELGKHLEDYYRIFFQTFAGFLTKPAELNKLFSDGVTADGSPARKYVVHFYRTRQEYAKTLKSLPKLDPAMVDKSTGLYVSGPDRRKGQSIAYFFHNTEATEEDRLATMFHEATHQLFSEAIASGEDVGVNSDFWCIEAIACYMESFKCQEETFTLGDPEYIRFQNAQTRLVQHNYVVSLQKLCRMGQDEYMRDPNVAMNYSQGAGLVHFFMHYDDGIYRDAFGAYLSDIYSDFPKVRAKPRSLEQLTDVPFAKLDQQYRGYIEGLDTGLQLQAPAGQAGP